MSTVRRAAKNSTIIFLGEIVIRIVGFFITLLLVRYLGSADFGKYSLVYAYLSFFQIFTNMGIDSIIVRELSRNPQKGELFLGNAVSLRFFFSLIGIILCWTILQWLHYPIDIKLLIYLASLSIVFSLGALYNNIFQAKLLMKYIITVTIVIKLLLGALTFMLILFKAGLVCFILLNLMIYVLQIAAIFFISNRFLNVKIAMDFKIWKELLHASWPIVISIIFMSIYTRIDQVMLFHMKGKTALGFYAAAVKLAELPTLIPGAFMASLFPLLSEYHKTSLNSFRRTYQISFKYLMLFILPIAVMTTLYSRQIILVCYGPDFLDSKVALAILIWSAVFIYAGTVHSNILIAANLQRFDILFTGTILFVNFLLNLILIPRYSYMGAAIATTVSYGLFIPVSYSLRKTREFATALLKSMVRPLLAALTIGCLVYSISPLYSIFNFIVIGAIYLLFIFFIRELDAQDIQYIKKIINSPE